MSAKQLFAGFPCVMVWDFPIGQQVSRWILLAFMTTAVTGVSRLPAIYYSVCHPVLCLFAPLKMRTQVMDFGKQPGARHWLMFHCPRYMTLNLHALYVTSITAVCSFPWYQQLILLLGIWYVILSCIPQIVYGPKVEFMPFSGNMYQGAYGTCATVSSLQNSTDSTYVHRTINPSIKILAYHAATAGSAVIQISPLALQLFCIWGSFHV